MNRTHVTCMINDDETEFLCDNDESLLDALRDEVGLTGAKEGCGTGDCGACSIILNGQLICACLAFAPEANGGTIETVEGMADGDRLHPLQTSFLEEASLQCGVCTPGFLMAAKALLENNPDPTETEVRYAIAGNLSRCTGYDKIVRAVLGAAAQMRKNPIEGARP